MKIAVVSITHRTLNNIAPLLRALVDDGAECEVIWAPTSQRVTGQAPDVFGLRVALDFTGLQAADTAGLGRFADECGRFLHRYQPELVISDDMTTWPNRIVYEQVQKTRGRPWHLAWQHGLHQPWYELRQRFDADLFMCYGRIHAFMMGEAFAARVLPAGLPKLDRLGTVKTESGGFLSWFAQPLPEAPLQVELLTGVAAAAGLPVHLRPHPAAPDAFAGISDLPSRGLLLDDPATDPIDTLRRCDTFISTHSSAAIEALLLGKPAILFPSFGLTSFAGYPNVATDFTVRAYRAASKRIESRRIATEAFLVDCVGGRRFDHVQRGFERLEAIVAQRRRGMLPPDPRADGALAQRDRASA